MSKIMQRCLGEIISVMLNISFTLNNMLFCFEKYTIEYKNVDTLYYSQFIACNFKISQLL